MLAPNKDIHYSVDIAKVERITGSPNIVHLGCLWKDEQKKSLTDRSYPGKFSSWLAKKKGNLAGETRSLSEVT